MGSTASDLLVAVWKEASRRTDLGASTTAIVGMLEERMPVAALLVRELDITRSRLHTLAAGVVGGTLRVETAATELSPSQLTRLLAWCRRGVANFGPESANGHADSAWRVCLPAGTSGDALVGPLVSAAGVRGLLVALARPGRRFEPPHAATLLSVLEPFTVALDNHHRLHELQALREAAEAERQSLLTRLGRTQTAEAIVGADAGLRPVMERVELVAKSDVPVLILGETGAGKEVIARAIHTRSSRANGPFIRVNCGAIPPDLIDSQLFGHERGSFTGAVDTRRGWFERADGGTLFLDEIGDLSSAAQVRLLRVLQDGYLERIGGHDLINVDTRIVTATHRDLTAMVREGRFREDLWYRIAVFPVLLPPLRERREDIPRLARHFAERAAIRFGLPVQTPVAEDMALLVSYPWPGNVRELAAVIDRAMILGDGERLEVAKALGIPGAPATTTPMARASQAHVGDAGGVAPLDAAIRHHIEAALAATFGRIEGPYGAARLLKVNPHTLRARMRRLGVPWEQFRARA
jgi:transcriptional regulator with GAF, ATPase, and Fis domain